jgi:hypothetical protein
MSNQRRGRFHSASLNDEGGGQITLKELIDFVTQAQKSLEQNGEEDSALRFEILGDFLREDVANGTPFRFTTKALGL